MHLTVLMIATLVNGQLYKFIHHVCFIMLP